MTTYTKTIALATTILLTSAFSAGPANAETPSTASLDTVPTETSQLSAVKAEQTSQIKFERPAVTTTPAPTPVVAVEPLAAAVTPRAVKVEESPTTTKTAPPAPARTAPVAPQAPAAAVPSASGKGASIVAAAYGQIGINQDCTALVTNSLRAVGINFHDWPAGYMSLGTITSTPVPGDLIYYANGGAGVAHIAVYVGNGQAIHGGFDGTTKLWKANVGSGPVYIHIA